MATVEQLAAEAITLPGESRARLADLLVESLEGDDLWKREQLQVLATDAGQILTR